MKTILTSVAIILSINLFAQKDIDVEEKNGEFSLGKENGFSVDIPEADVDDVMKGWKEEMKDYKAKVSDKKDEMFADDAEMEELGVNTADIYAVFKETEEGMNMIVFVNLGGAYLSSSLHGDQAKFMEELIRKFAIEEAKDAIEEQIDAQDKILSGLESDQKSLEKENEDLHHAIEDYNDKIKKAEGDIKTNEKNQTDKKAAIEAQKTVIESVKKKLDGIK